MAADDLFQQIPRVQHLEQIKVVPLLEDLVELDLEKELITQYNTARRLLHDAEYGPPVALNQKAQAINAAASILGQLTKAQADLYSSQRFRKIEAVLVETMRAFPEMQEMFMEAYTEALS